MDGFVQSVAVYIVQLLPVVLDAQDHMKQLVLMEELIRFLQENNQMLKYICAYLSSQGSIEEQDQKNLMINILADLLVDNLGNKNR